MALNVCSWTDKQLDELMDMLRSADCSVVASFISQNFLCQGSRIMTDPTNTTMRVVVGSDTKTVELSQGVFQHAGYIGQIDTSQIINILDTTTGSWGQGQISDPGNPRWSIVCIRQNEQLHTSQRRWFVNDTVVPNTYYQSYVNTLINKAYYEIVVVHGSAGPVPTIPSAPSGFWTIAEIRIPAGATSIDPANIYDVGNPSGSQQTPPNWLSNSRVLRLEFFATSLGAFSNFGVDHDLLTGYHRLGGWHIGTGLVGATVTAPALNKLTDGTNLGAGELHSHGSGSGFMKLLSTPTRLFTWNSMTDWSDVSIASYVGSDTPKFAVVVAELAVAVGGVLAGETRVAGYFRKKGDAEEQILPRVRGRAALNGLLGWWAPNLSSCQLFVPLDTTFKFQVKLALDAGSSPWSGSPSSWFIVDLIGYC